MQNLKNLRRFEPRINFKINKFIPTSNYSLTHYKGDNYRDMISFATNVQQITLGALYCKFNNYNFYSKPHERIINYKDPFINIQWPKHEKEYFLSNKDLNAPFLDSL